VQGNDRCLEKLLRTRSGFARRTVRLADRSRVSMALCLIVWCAAASGGHAGRRTRRHTALARLDSPSLLDGAKHRIEFPGAESRYLYAIEGGVVAHRVFFSLFKWQLDAGDRTAGTLSDHAGGSWLAFRADDGAPRLTLSEPPANNQSVAQSVAQRFWWAAAPRYGPGCYTMHLDRARATALGRDATDPTRLTRVSASAADVAAVCALPVLAPQPVPGPQGPMGRRPLQ